MAGGCLIRGFGVAEALGADIPPECPAEETGAGRFLAEHARRRRGAAENETERKDER